MKHFCFNALFLLSVKFTALIAADPQPGDFNVYTIQNIGKSNDAYKNSDFQGLTGAGGNIYLQSFGINTSGGQPGSYGVYSGGSFSLLGGQVYNGGVQSKGNITIQNAVISGNVVGGGNLQSPPSTSAGSINGNVNLFGANTSNAVISGTTQQNTGIYLPTVNLTQVSSFFQQANTSLGSKAQSGWVTTQNNYGTLNVSGLQSGLNIVNISQSLENSLYTLNFSGAADALVVLNILGDGSSQSVKGLSVQGLSTDQLLFNINNIANLTMGGGPYYSVLAPFSDVTFNSGALTGNLIANNLYGSGQVNVGLFKGWNTIVTIPEPHTYLLMTSWLALAVGMILIKKRRIQQ